MRESQKSILAKKNKSSMNLDLNFSSNIFISRKTPNSLQKFINLTIFICFISLFLYTTLNLLGISLNFELLTRFKSQFFTGFKMTIIISVFALILSMLIGALAAKGYDSPIILVSYFSKFYVQLIRGTPLLVQVYFFYYIVGTAWGLDNRYVAGILILSIFEGAYISEIIRGGLTSIDTQQYEIAQVIGLSKFQTSRFVIFPQLMIRILPALAGQFASIIKDSSLLSIVAIIELTHATQEISAINYGFFENYLFLGFLYLLLTLPISLLSKYLEKRFDYAR